MYKLIFIVFLLVSCSPAKNLSGKKQYRRSGTIAAYSAMANELEDEYIELKENGYFAFYEKLWLLITIKQGTYIGRYTKQEDTLYLDWQGTDPKELKYYLSSKCVLDSAAKELWFIDELTNQRLRKLSRRLQK